MKTKFIILADLDVKQSFLKSKKSKVAVETENSVEAAVDNGDDIDYCYRWAEMTEEQALNQHFERNAERYEKDEYTHVCLVPNESEVLDNYLELVEPYVIDKDTAYIPLVELMDPPKSKKEAPKFRMFYNGTPWIPYGVHEVGTVNVALAKYQIDTTLYGTLLPLSAVKKHKFKTKIKYFSFYEYLTRLAYNKVDIVGIPKVAFKCVKDFSFPDEPKEEKKKHFIAAQHEYIFNEDREVLDTYDEVVEQETVEA